MQHSKEKFYRFFFIHSSQSHLTRYFVIFCCFSLLLITLFQSIFFSSEKKQNKSENNNQTVHKSSTNEQKRCQEKMNESHSLWEREQSNGFQKEKNSEKRIAKGGIRLKWIESTSSSRIYIYCCSFECVFCRIFSVLFWNSLSVFSGNCRIFCLFPWLLVVVTLDLNIRGVGCGDVRRRLFSFCS